MWKLGALSMDVYVTNIREATNLLDEITIERLESIIVYYTITRKGALIKRDLIQSIPNRQGGFSSYTIYKFDSLLYGCCFVGSPSN